MKTINDQRRFIFISVLGLTLLGILLVYESSCIYAYKLKVDPEYFLKRQLIFFVLGLISFFVSLLIDIDLLRRYCKETLIAIFVVLIAVIIIGKKAGGASRWLTFSFFNFQPSEMLKVFFLFYAIDYFIRKGSLIRDLKEGLMPLGIVLAVMCCLLLAQPDLGTALFWVLWTALLLYFYKAKTKHLLTIGLLGLLGLIVLIKLYPYRMRRIVAYLDPFADPQGAGFQLVQSQIAYGEGGFFGVGFGAGRQKLSFLPAAHTDFIFSIIAEEFGLIGSLSVMAIFYIIIRKMITIAQSIDDEFRYGLLWGIIFIFFLEIIINIGVTSGVFPTKGLSLPFISYGGSNLITHYILLGLFFNISHKREPNPNKVKK